MYNPAKHEQLQSLTFSYWLVEGGINCICVFKKKYLFVGQLALYFWREVAKHRAPCISSLTKPL